MGDYTKTAFYFSFNYRLDTKSNFIEIINTTTYSKRCLIQLVHELEMEVPQLSMGFILLISQNYDVTKFTHVKLAFIHMQHMLNYQQNSKSSVVTTSVYLLYLYCNIKTSVSNTFKNITM